MSELRALIFDVDGTLAETERDAHLPAFNEAFAAHGLEWHWSESLYGELLKVTGGKERIRYYLEKWQPPCPPVEDLSAFIATLHAEKTACYVQRVSQGQLPLRPGVKRIIHEARQAGLRLAIATTTSMQNVQALLEYSLHPQAMDWFEIIGAGDVVSAKKPAPDIYDYVLERLGLKPEQCLALEDSQNGLYSAQGAGLQTIITFCEYTREEDFSGALLVADQFGEPDQPCRFVQGDPGEHGYINVELLRQLVG